MKQFITKCILFAGLPLLISFPHKAHALFSFAKFTVIVVDEQGEALPGVRVGVGFEKNIGWGTDSAGQYGISGQDGRLSFSGQCNGHVTYGGRRDGYYDSYYDYDFKERSTLGWQPWNPELKVVLRKIENPVPMYAREAGKKVPVIGKEVGFDLMKFDWVVPHGIGTHSDFIFELEKRFVSLEDFDVKVTLTFPYQFDGIYHIKENREYGSEFKLPRLAHETGYLDKIEITMNRKAGQWFKTNYKEDDNYVFRIRSEKRDGKLEKAMYGKILGPIKVNIVGTDTAVIRMRVYLNPDYTRNLEFDPKRNLFGNLPDLEQVNEP